MSGRRSERVYAVRSGAERWAFVPHPEINGYWLRTDLCVLVVACAQCKSARGVPCKGANGYRGATHWVRRRDGKEGVAALDYATCIVTNVAKGKDQPCV